MLTPTCGGVQGFHQPTQNLSTLFMALRLTDGDLEDAHRQVRDNMDAAPSVSIYLWTFTGHLDEFA